MLARSYDPPLDISYLSLLFAGKRKNPGVAYATQIAKALGMDLQTFITELTKVSVQQAPAQTDTAELGI